jgi:hypothetical protein
MENHHQHQNSKCDQRPIGHNEREREMGGNDYQGFRSRGGSSKAAACSRKAKI